MWYSFNFTNGSNPYIAKTDKELFRMFCKYNYTQIGNNSFVVTGVRTCNRKQSYNDLKELVRDIAIEWQLDSNNRNYSYGELSSWQGFFEEYGKRYGLLKEFHENCIC